MSSTAEKVRFTITVDQDVHEVFSKMAETSGVSLSRCVGDWLRDTSEAAQLAAMKMQEVRSSTERAMHLLNHAIAQETMVKLAGPPPYRWTAAAKSGRGGMQAQSAPGAAAFPPSSNTGGKSPTKKARK